MGLSRQPESVRLQFEDCFDGLVPGFVWRALLPLVLPEIVLVQPFSEGQCSEAR